MVEKRSGKVEYAVISFGGLLGMATGIIKVQQRAANAAAVSFTSHACWTWSMGTQGRRSSFCIA
jgi:hypothetical protein